MTENKESQQNDTDYIVNFLKDLIKRNPGCRRENFQIDARRLARLSEDDKFELYNVSNMKTRPVTFSFELAKGVDEKLHECFGKCDRFGCGGTYFISDFKTGSGDTTFRTHDKVTNSAGLTGWARDVGLYTFRLEV